MSPGLYEVRLGYTIQGRMCFAEVAPERDDWSPYHLSLHHCNHIYLTRRVLPISILPGGEGDNR